MESGRLLAILGGILTLVGTYVFAMYGDIGVAAGSGIGFITNLPNLFTDADVLCHSYILILLSITFS